MGNSRPRLAEFAAQIDSRRWASHEVLAELRSQTRNLALRGTALRTQLSRRLPEQKHELLAWLSALDDLDDGELDRISADLERREAIHDALLSSGSDVMAPSAEGTTKRDLRNVLRRVVAIREPNVDVALLAGLSFMLVKYNPALEVSYYHQLLSDLVPSSVLTEIGITVSIPQWQGTSGWVSERARLLAHQWPEFRGSPQPVVLYSAISDARGRNTVNRYVLGSRSWLGIPLFGDSDRPVGIVVATFPIDGLFYDVAMEVSPFAQTFQQLVGTARSDLLRALRMDERASVFPMGPQPSARVWERNRVGEQARRLLPDFPTPDDPLGLLAVIQGNRSANAAQDVHVQFRERSVIDPLYQLVELASTFPDHASPTATRVLDRMSKEPHADALAWHLQDQGEDHLAELYPKDAIEVARTVQLMRCGLEDQRSSEPLRPLRNALERGLKLAKGPLHQRKVVDLVMPLVGKGHKVEGYVRFNCTRHAHADEAFARMYSIIRGASKALRPTLGALLELLAERVVASRGSLTRLKLLSSLRASLCEAVAWRAARAFYPNDHREPELRRLDLFRAAARSLGEEVPFEAALRALEEFCQHVAEHRKEFPDVILVSFWLHAERPVVKALVAERGGLAELFMADRSFVRMLHLLVEYHFKARHNRFEHHDTYWHRREDNGDVIVIPPACRASPGNPEEQPLDLEVSKHGKSVRTVLRTGDGWRAELTWVLRRYPRPMAYQSIPRGIAHNIFGDVRVVPMRVVDKDLDAHSPESLEKTKSSQDTILTRAKELIDFVSLGRPDQKLWWRSRQLEPRQRRANARAWLWVVDRGSAEEESRQRALCAAVDAWRTDGEFMEYGQRRFSRHSITGRSSLRSYLKERAKVDSSAEAALATFNRLDTLISIDTGELLWVSKKLPELLSEMSSWYQPPIRGISGHGQWSFNSSDHGDVLLLLDNLLTNATKQGNVRVRYAAEEGAATIAVTNQGEMPLEARNYLNRETDEPPRQSGARARQGLEIMREIVDRYGWTLAADYDRSGTTITLTIRKVAR